jgi:hypothetical protein
VSGQGTEAQGEQKRKPHANRAQREGAWRHGVGAVMGWLGGWWAIWRR